MKTSNGIESKKSVYVGRSSFLVDRWRRLENMHWSTAVWIINGAFILMTAVYWYLPNNRQGLGVLLALFSLQFEKNVATGWEGWCLSLVAILALERFFRNKLTHQRRAWLGLAILSACLSLDELGSVHERIDFLCKLWELPKLPNIAGSYTWLGAPALIILCWTLKHQWQDVSKRAFWFTLGGFIVFGLVGVQEYLERHMYWPTWLRGIRFALEEGSELVGVFLLMCAVIAPAATSAHRVSLKRIWPSATALIRMRPAVVGVTLLGLLPMTIFTVVTLSARSNFGIPVVWLPIMLLNLTGLAAWTCARHAVQHQALFRCAALVAMFFALDQLIVFQRVLDMNLLRGQVELLMLPCMAVLCLRIPSLRTPTHMGIFAALLLCSILLVLNTPFWHRLVIPLQALGIYFVMISSLIQVIESKVEYQKDCINLS